MCSVILSYNKCPMTYFPVAINLVDQRILIIGGGKVALRKFKALHSRGAQITIVASQISPEISKFVNKETVCLHKRPFQDSDLTGQDLVIIATDDVALNDKIVKKCRQLRILFNCATGTDQGFLMTSFFERDELMISVSSGGSSPVRSKAVREQLESLFPES